MNSLVFLFLLSGVAFSAIPIETQANLLRSARNADIQAYFYFTGVVLGDAPQISPFFACQRAFVYQNYSVNGTLMVDRVSCQKNSYYKQAWQGIQMCNRGDRMGKFYLDRSIGYPVAYSC